MNIPTVESADVAGKRVLVRVDFNVSLRGHQEIANDKPAVFLYAPYFIYITPQKVQNVTLGSLGSAAERFSNVYQWYIETNNVWKIFIEQNINA